MSQFEKDIASVINKHCGENTSDTADFILAAYLNDCLTAFNRASNWRKKWRAPEGVPEHERESGPVTSWL
jgi:hypothetical protein